jgi:hypothetical protein
MRMCRRIAVLLRGRSDALAVESIESRLLVPLRHEGHAVDLYMCTYDDSPNLQRLSDRFPESEMLLLPSAGSSQAATALAGLAAVAESGRRYDTILVTRFDVELKLPWPEWPSMFEEDKLCFLWWEKARRSSAYVSDVFLAFPGDMLDIVRDAVSKTSEKNTKHMHGLYEALAPDVRASRTRVLYPEVRRDSNTDLEQNPFYAITRPPRPPVVIHNPMANAPRLFYKRFNIRW